MGEDTSADGATKRCPRCGETKSRAAFARNRSTGDGLQGYCRDCSRETSRALAAKNQAKPPLRHGQKACAACRVVKPMADFGIDRARKDGRSYYCRTCLCPHKLEQSRVRRDARAVALIEDSTAAKICSGCAKTKPVEEFTPNLWVVGGREHRCRECRRPTIDAHKQRWRSENPEKWSLQNREHVRRRRAAMRLVETEQVDYEAILARYGRICHICGEPVTEPRGTASRSLSFDHVIPISRGGPHIEANILPARQGCNSRKHTKIL